MSTQIYLWKRSRYCDNSNYRVVAREFSFRVAPIFEEKKWKWSSGWDKNFNGFGYHIPTQQEIENLLVDMWEKKYQSGRLLLWETENHDWYFGLERDD